jgi:coenzyme F420 hydrogenase subunit beta
MSKAETSVFGRQRKPTEKFGIHERVSIAKAADGELLGACQDGGVVTAALLHALNNKLIDCAVLSGIHPDRPFYPVAALALTPKEILSCAGTRYTYSPNLLALTDTVKWKRTAVAFVGTPCQIRAVRKMQLQRLKTAANVRLMIGLMCSECFTYDGLMEKHLHQKRGIDLRDIKKINIKGKMMVTLKSGTVESVPLADIMEYAVNGCAFCRDFSAELADISAGGLGLEGWTLTVVRTKEGQNIFDKAEERGTLRTRPLQKNDPSLSLLVRLSRRKQCLGS